MVILPLLLGAVLVTVSQSAVGPVQTASVTAYPVTGERAFTFGTSGHGQLAAGGDVRVSSDIILLKAGAVLVTSPGITAIKAGDAILIGWNGGFHASMERSGIRIAALTTPVLVQSPAGDMIVPVQTQWELPKNLPKISDGYEEWLKTRTPTALPDFFRLEQTSLLQSMEEETVTIAPVTAVTDVLSSALEVVELDAASKRRQDALETAALTDLRHALTTADRTRVQELLSQDATIAALQRGDGLDLVPEFAGLAAKQGVLPLFLSHFIKNPDYWLLAAFHPQSRDMVWVTDVPLIASRDERLLRLLLTPGSDMLAEGMAPLAVDHWTDDAIRYATEQKDPVPFLSFLLRHASAHTAAAITSGFPERAERYIAAMETITDRFKLKLPSEILALPAQARRFEIPVTEHMEPTVEPVTEPEPSAPLEPLPGIADTARSTLLGAGAMLMQTTVIEPVGGSVVEVRDVVFATPQGDLPLAFTLDAVTNLVTDISAGGRMLPYELPFEKYLEWVRAGMKTGE